VELTKLEAATVALNNITSAASSIYGALSTRLVKSVLSSKAKSLFL